MVRLHDFEDYKNLTPWNYCGPPHATHYFSKYHLSGGLSRLNIAFATKWHKHLFGRTYVYNSAHVRSLLTNLLDLYPDPRDYQSITANALLVDFGLDLLRKSRDNKTIRKDVIRELGTITSGYHYRKAVHYLTGKSSDHNLFFSEIKQLGERFLKKKKYLDESTIKALSEHPPPRLGGIYYHTFGNLVPQPFTIFPQGVSNFFDNGWISGEMVDEFQIKLSWHLYKKNIPPFLLGQVLYSYLNRTAPRVFSQSHFKDYFATYFMFKIFNNSHLSKIIKNLQKKGYLKLKMRRNTGPKAYARRAQSAGHSILFRTSHVHCALRFALCAFLIITSSLGLLHGETMVIPGNINQICSYTNFFYHFPSENFTYYLNDRLLFMEKPDGKIEDNGLRNKLLKIVQWHRIIKKSLERVSGYKNNMVIIHVANQEEFEKARIILNLLGLRIEKTLKGQFRVSKNPASGFSDYYRFSQLNTGTITRQLNRARHFYFKLEESEIPVPWDYEFLREVTGLKIDSTSFFETMLKNEQFSLLLGILYRLSDREDRLYQQPG